jgi:hypothetical protein
MLLQRAAHVSLLSLCIIIIITAVSVAITRCYPFSLVHSRSVCYTQLLDTILKAIPVGTHPRGGGGVGTGYALDSGSQLGLELLWDPPNLVSN